jgi:hypothetical protein
MLLCLQLHDGGTGVATCPETCTVEQSHCLSLETSSTCNYDRSVAVRVED